MSDVLLRLHKMDSEEPLGLTVLDVHVTVMSIDGIWGAFSVES